jgi:hypothetical protein
MTYVPPGLSWIQWCTWISGPPLIPTEEFVFPLVEAIAIYFQEGCDVHDRFSYLLQWYQRS